MASSLGYSGKSVISHIEKGDADMTYEKILLLLRTYMADANELFDLESTDKQIEEWKFQQRKSRSVLVYIQNQLNPLFQCNRKLQTRVKQLYRLHQQHL